MGDMVISVENVSKEYRLGSIGTGTLFRDLQSWWAKVRGLPDPNSPLALSGVGQPRRENTDSFLALDGVSFEVKKGEVLGVIGRNGAGKSTLLKILSRVTTPSSGRIRMKGRVASLLEVGTGFHPELTGRENIYLNGAILGMKRSEIRSKFDEIVEFAELTKFVDTPVKRYSSGMYVRLAFAVAAHLDPEILIIDEVLAVGDAQFQKKCLGKMQDVSGKEGRTVLFVSHNIDIIKRLCTKCLFLEKGRERFFGACEEGVSAYLNSTPSNSRDNKIVYPEADESTYHVKQIEFRELDGTEKERLQTWDSFRIRVVFHSPEDLAEASVVVRINSLSGTELVLLCNQPDLGISRPFHRGENVAEYVVHRLHLSAGRYLIGAALGIANKIYLFNGCDFASIEVGENDIYGSGLVPHQSRFFVPHQYEYIKS